MASPIEHVLVPVDFDEPSENAAELAVDLALKLGAKVTLLHVWQVPMYAYSEGIYFPLDALEREAKNAMDALVRKLAARHPKLTGTLAHGNPHDRITETAKEIGADLIVMGTHGRRGITHVVLGSVAEKVVRSSPIPVLTVSARAS